MGTQKPIPNKCVKGKVIVWFHPWFIQLARYASIVNKTSLRNNSVLNVHRFIFNLPKTLSLTYIAMSKS